MSLDLDRYLARLGYDGPRHMSRDTLHALHEAHMAAIPFENLDILLGSSISLALPDLQRKLIDRRRGGYCFEQNTLFRAVLETLGFQVTSLAARVRGGGVLRPRTHMVLRVDLDDGPWLADVGFGGEGPIHPVPLVAEDVAAGTPGFRLRQEEDLWVLTGDSTGERTDLYAFTLEPQFPVDFEMANHFTSTWPRSPFVQSLTAQRSWPDRRAILRNRDLTIRDGVGVRSEIIRDPGHLLEVLHEVFGLTFPPGTCFSRPEF